MLESVFRTVDAEAAGCSQSATDLSPLTLAAAWRSVTTLAATGWPPSPGRATRYLANLTNSAL